MDNLPSDIELLILKTGFSSNRGSEVYWKNQPVVKASLASMLRNKFPDLRVFGFDMISLTSKLDRPEGKMAHIEFLVKNEILIIEDMDLNCLERTPDTVVVSPLQIYGADDEIQQYLRDQANLEGNCEQVFIVEHASEISDILIEANQSGTPVTVCGNHTSLTGASLPLSGWVISTERLNRIHEINPHEFYVDLEPGVVLKDLQQSLKAYGLFFPPDPTEDSCCIGGMVGTNASGAKSFKYGAVRAFVEQLEVTLSQGQQVVIKKEDCIDGNCFELLLNEEDRITFDIPESYILPRVKNAVGYYLKPNMQIKDLFVGAEGTLGVITKLRLRVMSLPLNSISFVVFFDVLKDSFTFLDEVRGFSKSYTCETRTSRMQARALEFFDERSLSLLKGSFSDIPEKAQAALWVEQECTDESNYNELLDQWYNFINSGKEPGDVWFGADASDRAKIVNIRHTLPVLVNDVVRSRGMKKLGTDVAVPDAAFEAFYKTAIETVRAEGIEYVAFGHFGDSHLHLNLLPSTSEELEKAQLLYHDLCARAIALGGTFSAEHGVGKLKKKYLEMMFGELNVQFMKSVKKIPEKIFNEYLDLAARDIVTFFSAALKTEISCPACGGEGDHWVEKSGFTYKLDSLSTKFWATTFYKITEAARREKLWKPKAQLEGDPVKFVIDIGGGYGVFDEEIRLILPVEPFVIEPSKHLAEVCRAKGLNVLEKFMEDVTPDELPRGRKCYVSFELFEHLYDPEYFLKVVFDGMEAGDLFIFTTLSGAGLDIQVLGEHAKALSPPHHLNFMNPKSVSHLLNKIGFVVLEANTPGKLDIDILNNNKEFIQDKFWLMDFIDISGFGHSGKTVVTDYLKQYTCVYGFSNHVEFELFRVPGGLIDLYYSLFESWNLIRGTARIKEFRSLVYRIGQVQRLSDPMSYFTASGHGYDQYFNGKFIEISEKFIDQLIKGKQKTFWPYENLRLSPLEVFVNKFKTRFFNSLLMAEIYFSDRNQFIDSANEYLQNLFKQALEPNHTHVLLNNGFDPFNPKACLDMAGSAFAVTVDRDPRDIYASQINANDNFIPDFEKNNYTEKIKKTMTGFSDIDLFIFRYEDFVLDHENQAELLKSRLGIDNSAEKINTGFDIKKSSKNVGVWKKYADMEEIKRIETELGEYYSGVPILFARMASYIAEHFPDSNITIIDYENGAIARNVPKLNNIEVLVFRDGQDITPPENSVLIMQSFVPYHWPAELKVLPETRLFFWNLHPKNFIPSLLPIASLRDVSFNNFKLFSLLATLFSATIKKLRNFVELLIEHKALCFMDQTNYDLTRKFLFMKEFEKDYLPVPASKNGRFERKNDIPVGVFNYCWLGRICDFKAYILVYTAEQLAEIAERRKIDINYYVIGDGELMDYAKHSIKENAFFKVIYTGALPHTELDLFLMEKIDVVTAMGTSALEGAKLGIPTLLLDFSYEEIKKDYIFRKLYDARNYDLGHAIGASDLKTGNSSLEEIVLQISQDYKGEANKTYDYYLNNHSMESTVNKFLELVGNTELRYKQISSRLSKSVVGPREAEAVSRVILEDGYLGMGAEVGRFEDEISSYLGVGQGNVVCVNTGTSALHLAVDAITNPGDEILVPSLTFLSSFQAISACGAVPVPCEVYDSTLTIDLENAERKITTRTRAIMAVHYASNPAYITQLYELAAKYNLRVIEDAAHAFGCEYKSKKIGSFGDIICFSFDGIKNITSGEGGAIVSSDKEFLSIVKDTRLLAIEKDSEKRYAGARSWDFDVKRQGFRYHMSNIFAAIGRVQLDRLVEDFIPKRILLFEEYLRILSENRQLKLMEYDRDSKVVPHILPVRVLNNKRDQLKEYLESNGVPTGIHYKPNHLLSFYKNGEISLPITEKIYSEILTLPFHPDLEVEDVRFICDLICKAIKDLE
eukprot:gene4767-5554_t